MKTHLELIIASTVWPDPQSREAIWRDLALPSLSTLYGKGVKTRSKVTGIEAKFSACFGLQDIPVAPLLLQGHSATLPAGYYLCVDPISLRVDRDHLTVLGEPLLSVTQAETDALIQALNRLYRDDGYEFFASSPKRWFVRLPQDPELTFTPYSQALGRNLNDVLPKGEGALKFNALLNEMQMLLYAHPVNDARDAASQLLVNSLWLWGGGHLPLQATANAPKAVFGANELVQTLSGAHHAPQQLTDLPDLNAIVLLDQLEQHTAYGAGYEWQQQMLRWEADWFAPALAALKTGQLDALTVHLSDTGEQCTIKKADLWRFWRKADLPRALDVLAS